MLTISDGKSHLNRRKFLEIGSLGLGGLTLANLLATQGYAAQQQSSILRGKSVIFLFQQGGPSQLETFDPKPNAPSATRTVGGTIQTSIPGVLFGSKLERLAKHADKLSVVRNYSTENAGHNIRPLVGPDSLETNIGTHYSRVVGATDASSGMPTNMVLFPQSVDKNVPTGKARGDLKATGEYSSGYAPFIPGSGGQLQKNMEIKLSRDRLFNDRRALLKQLDRFKANMDTSGQFEAMDAMIQQAYQLLLTGGISKALDLGQEDPELLKRYDTSHFAKRNAWNKVSRGKRGFYYGQTMTMGKLLLLAKRLCVAGCGFVTVHAGYDGVWDMHADGNNLNMHDGMTAIGPSFDHAVSAFIEDLEASGLANDIMLICSGEMGRTPNINKRGGRDHWSRLGPLMIYGGGTKGGRVIGQSDSHGGEPAGNGYSPKHLIATILQTMFDHAQLRVDASVPSTVMGLSDHATIEGIV